MIQGCNNCDFYHSREGQNDFCENNREEVIEEIRKHTKEIRYILGKKVGQQLRHIPELFFYLDDSFDYAEKIDKLLK